MIKYIAFLRGINIGGHNLIKMDSLKKSFESEGMKNVRTYIQSGNVVFESGIKNVLSLTKKIEKQLLLDYGKEIKTMIRTFSGIQEMVNQDPFNKNKVSADSKFYVYFLYEEIPSGKKLPEITKEDAAEVIYNTAKEIFVVSYPTKDGRYGYPKNFTDKKLGTFYTARNWNTVCKILSHAEC